MSPSRFSKTLSQRDLSPSIRRALNAVRNASRAPVSVTDIEAILSTGLGRPTHVRALFGDLALDRVFQAGAAFGIDAKTVLIAYGTAKLTAEAANFDLDTLVG